jgi:plasmid maintenance system antidote protein VapI
VAGEGVMANGNAPARRPHGTGVERKLFSLSHEAVAQLESLAGARGETMTATVEAALRELAARAPKSERKPLPPGYRLMSIDEEHYVGVPLHEFFRLDLARNVRLDAAMRQLDADDGSSEGELRSRGRQLLAKAIYDRALTQNGAETAIGSPKGAMSRWVNGVRKPGRQWASRLEEAFGVPMAAWDAEPDEPDVAATNRAPLATTKGE